MVLSYFSLIFRSGVAGLLLSTLLLAQNPYGGRIIGRVADSSGALVPNAAVECVNLGTNVVSSANTTSNGNFELPNLIPGQYRLSISVAGFKKYEQGPLELRVGDTLNIPIALQVGAQAETVTVTAAAPLLEAANAETGLSLDARRVADLPVPASNVLFMALFGSTNMTGTTSPMSTFTPDGNDQPTGVAAGGTLRGQSLQSVDGMPTMEYSSQMGIVPPPEVVEEVKISTSLYDASQGHFTGALVSMVTKSGTNDLHGAVAIWNQNTTLNSIEFFSGKTINNPATGPVTHAKIRSQVPYLNWFRERGTLGGPVYIPKVYNGRNRTFWQYGGDHFHMPYSTAGYRTVPTPAERTGDFSALLALGSQYQIYDPYSAVATPGGHVSRTPLPGNIVPASRQSPVALQLMQYWPQPNTTPASNGTNNYYGGPYSSIDYTASFLRLDQVVNDKNRAYFSYNRYCLYALQNIYFGQPSGNIYPTGAIQANCHQMAALDESITPSPTWVLDFRYGITHFTSYAPSTTNGFNTNSIGMWPGLMSGVDTTKTTIPALSIDSVTGIGAAAGSQSGIFYQNFFASASHMRGNHTIRFGLDLRSTARDSNPWGNVTPAYTFSSNWTVATDTAAAAPIGQGLASFVYGLPTTGSITKNDSYAALTKMFGWYVQDDWKVTSKLSVNLGIRQELEFPETERFNRANRGFDLTTANPIQAAAQANYALNPISQIPASQFRVLGGQLFTSSGNRGIYGMNPHNFMPRIGVSYQVGSHTVVRGGYGIFFESLGAEFVTPTQDGYSQTTTMVPSPDNGLSFPVNLQNNPFPNGVIQPTGASGGLSTYLGRSISFLNPGRQQGYAQRWTLNVQHQFGQRLLVEVGYMGNRGTRLGTTNAWDSLPIQYLSRSPVRDNATINALAAQVPNPFYGISQFASTTLATPTVAVSQLLLPYPEFTGVTSTDDSGFSWYHALSVRVEKRFSHGFTVQSNYTWSKFMEADARQNGIQSPLEHSISSSDRPQQLGINGIYELPFGKGRHFLSSLSGWADRIAGGWQVEAVYTAQSGSPMSFGNILFTGNLHDIALPKSQRTIQQYFNTAAGFNTVSAQQLASNYQSFPPLLTGVRNPGLQVFNMSGIKRVRLYEKSNLEIRLEAKNALNHPNWGGPNTSPTSATFGQVTSSLGGRMVTLQAKVTW